MEIMIDASQLTALVKRFEDRPRKIRRKMRNVARDTPDYMKAALVRHASGRPGPNVVTGGYVGAFYTALLNADDDAVIVVGGNPSPQAARLEYGFFGVDSLGRNYAQPAYPHFRPALIETQRWYLDQMKKILREELG